MASAMRSPKRSADRRLPTPRSISGIDVKKAERSAAAKRRLDNSSVAESAKSFVVQQLPRPQVAQPWLKMLLHVQRVSSITTFSLIIGLLAVYGWTVYTQQRWGRAYSHLEALQKQERQMTAASEVLKNQMAKQAEAPDVGLVLPDPGNTVFLTPAPQRAPVEPEVNLPPPQPIPARPLGY